MDEDARFAEIDEALAELEERVASCRRAMLLSQVALVGSTGVFLGLLVFGSFERSPVLMLATLASFFGALVWLGASRASRDQAALGIAELEQRKNAMIDLVGARNGWRDITPTVH